MTSDGDALLRAICEQPWENTPRLIYADWLEENGQPERAEFIRLQIELEGIPPSKRCNALQYDRAIELERKCDPPLAELLAGQLRWPERLWSAELPAREGVVWQEGYIRGFRYVVAFASMMAVRNHADAVMMASPVEDVAVMQLQGRGEVGELLALPWIFRLTTLHLSGSVGARGVEMIARCKILNRLEYLDLSKAQIADPGLRALASSINLPNLKRLGLSANSPGVTEAGLNALLHSLTLDKLTAVDGVQHTLSRWTNSLHIEYQFYNRFPDSR